MQIQMEPKQYICQLHNVESEVGSFEVCHGVWVKQLDEEILEILSGLDDRRVYRPWQNRPAWFLVAKHQNDPTHWINGDPSGAIRVFRLALLTCFGERVLIGASIHIKLESSKPRISGILYHTWIQRDPVCPSNEYVIRQSNVDPLRSLFAALVQHHHSPPLATPLRWFSKACEENASPSDSVLDLGIALEALYLNKDSDKGEQLGRRGAVFTGVDATTREDVYVKLRLFYRARNKVVHEGEEYPSVSTSSGITQDIVGLQKFAFSHSRMALGKLLQNVPTNKQLFVQDLDSKLQQFTQDFQNYKNSHFP